MYSGKKIVFGVSGGIAIYKALDVISKLKKMNFEIDVIMTKHAQEFISPMTFQAMSGRMVASDMFNQWQSTSIEHIALAKKADVFCIVPATANIIGKIANGIADDMLTTTVLATEAPILIAPAMNSKMYENTIVQENMDKLKGLGMHFISPDDGRLACGDIGVGKLATPDDIVEAIIDIIDRKDELLGKNVLVTAGPTLERIDPVRFISNNSTGKMGYAIAKMAHRYGANVKLVSGPVNIDSPYGVSVEFIETSQEMYDKVMENFEWAEIIIKSAAVLDYKPKNFETEKIKKVDGDLSIAFGRTKDILFELGKIKGNKLLIGFAAETNNVVDNAKEKLIRKNADMIVANDVSNKAIGFKSDQNEVYFVMGEDYVEKIDIASKEEIAKEIIKKIVSMLK
ncbi:MAG: bifunctional phosphopantothenoylcysteine decarboxylase/phosphopantothenate--cysteine ligase CoaBC [Clostridiales bacterium]|nr:bifunctional phosphopantothenoylcysteine decarboxylase/phosphopantothenate--cysteine ligase CoaBC [Clostridiales bacterium]